MMKLCIVFLLCVAVLVQGRNVKKVHSEMTAKRDASVYYGLRCRGDNGGCCTDDNPCDKGDGDCDYDSQCARDLVCGNSNCKFPGDDDCCEEKYVYYAKEYPDRPQHREALCLQGRWASGDGKGGSEESIGTTSGYADCASQCNNRRQADKSINGCTFDKSSKECYVEHNMYYVGGSSSYDTCYLPYLDASGLRCQGANDGCCTKNNPCGLDDGDCDTDDQCMGSLYCGSANCAWGYDDCCMARHVGDEKSEKTSEVVKKDGPIHSDYIIKESEKTSEVVKEDDPIHSDHIIKESDKTSEVVKEDDPIHSDHIIKESEKTSEVVKDVKVVKDPIHRDYIITVKY